MLGGYNGGDTAGATRCVQKGSDIRRGNLNIRRGSPVGQKTVYFTLATLAKGV